ncbi:MAG: 2-oxo acid dehydrogenase subunit E2 [Clostridia bacterium]|nr:2-oxo acid dehydrogenase subunit E2 [Clostridia bacterium]
MAKTSKKPRRRWGDRRDAVRVREIDSMHAFMPVILPGRCDNEAFIEEIVDVEKIQAFVDKKNAANPEYKYTFFHVIAAAIAKTIYLRPKMNRFYAGDRLYQRNRIVLSFTAKKRFSDNGEEALVFLPCDGETTIDSLHDMLCEKVSYVRKDGNQDHTTDMMDIFVKMPRWLLRIVRRVLFFMNYYDITPRELIREDPYQATVFLSNLGSIKLNAAYHHLAEWGTNSIFGVIGRKHKRVVVTEDGTAEIREVLKLSMTLDERIADGYYYSKTIRLLHKILQNPEILDRPAKEEVDYE